MKILQIICLTVVQLAAQATSAIRALADSFHAKPRLTTAAQREAERIDRIRNPSNYIGR